MRVLQVIDSLRIGGAEVLLRDLAPRLRDRGVHCEVVVLSRSSSQLETSLETQGIAVHDTGVPKLYSLRHVAPLARMMDGFDVVHVHLFPAQLWAVLAASRLRPRVPLITTEHNTWNARRRWWLRPFDIWMYPHFRSIVCNSEATRQDLVHWCPNIAAKTLVISNGIVVEAFDRAQPATLPTLGPGVLRTVFVGRFEPQKDHDTLLRAVAMLPSVHLLLLGDGPLRSELEQVVRQLGITERVSFLGFRDDVPAILKACDVYVHSTTSDGFGIAACEAMATGLPVLASDVPGLAQVVEGAGILFPVGNAEILARELNLLAGSSEKRARMSAASRKRAAEFSIERTVDRHLQLYESIVGKSTTREVVA